MANFSIVIVPTKKLANGRHRIRIAVAHRSKTRYIPTQFTLDSASQLKNGRVIRHEYAANINSCLRRIIDEYEEILASIGYLSTISCTELIHIITYEQKKKGITFQTIAREYLSFMAGEERHKSYSLYKIASERFIKYMKGDFPLIQLTPLHVQEFAENLYKEGLTDTTIRIYLTLIKVILNYASKMNYVTYHIHPFVLFKMPECNIRDLDLSVDELKSIRDTMFLKELLEGTTVAGDYPQADICDIVYDSRKARPGTSFVCMKGETTDGHKYAKSAYDLGCRVFVAEEALSLPGDAIVLMSENTRRDLAQMSINFFGHPADELKMIGITGTKGKTRIT